MPAPALLVLWQLSGVVALRSWGPLLGEAGGQEEGAAAMQLIEPRASHDLLWRGPCSTS